MRTDSSRQAEPGSQNQIRMCEQDIQFCSLFSQTSVSCFSEAQLLLYNCVGAIFIPDVFPLPAPQVSVNTRKGVVVNCAPGQLAV